MVNLTQNQENILSSVKNAIKILRSFTMDDPQKGVRELASDLGLGKSSVQRILATLANEGFVRKNEETKKYELGLSVVELSSIVLGNIDLHNEALPIIKTLVSRCNETSHLAVLENLQAVYLCKVESEDSIELLSHTGLHNHTHCTSSGKLLLAHAEPIIVDTLLRNGLNKFTAKTYCFYEDFCCNPIVNCDFEHTPIFFIHFVFRKILFVQAGHKLLACDRAAFILTINHNSLRNKMEKQKSNSLTKNCYF